MPHPNVESYYARIRDDWTRSLLDWSDVLAQDHERVDDVCEILDRFGPEFDILKTFGSSYPEASCCFIHRCQVIRFTVEDVSDLLKAKWESVSDLAEVIRMMGVQVGRLMLAYEKDGQDRTVAVSEGRALAFHIQMQSDNRNISSFLRDMWQRLHFTVGGCECRQCRAVRHPDYAKDTPGLYRA
jgi:hypothetical protein